MRQKYGSKAENRKRCRNAGKSYTTSKNKKVDGKIFENIDYKYNKKCIEKIPEASRKRLFETF